MSLKPITIWFNPGPNPPKIVMVCEELGIPYEKVQVGDVKAESFTKINPNGRVPAIKDPNNGDLVLWESGAIVEYLVDTYDKDHKISIASGADKWHLRQYLHFQVSGQGPYYGQAVWFHRYHAEQVESAKERYLGQVDRVWGVLDNILKDKQYLVGDKYTYADLAFTPWEYGMHGFFAAETKHLECEKKYPHYWAWYQRLIARPSFKAAYGQ